MGIRENVYSFDLEWGYDEPLSVHVIDTGEATVLFGGGAEETAAELVDIASEHGVDVVLVEHGDGDHFDGVPALREELPEIEIAAPAGDVPFLEEADIDVEHPLDAGETYWGVETISAPGHTTDNMAYRYQDVLVAGDTVVGATSIFAASGDWNGAFAVITADYNADDADARSSVETLLEYDFDTVLVSHGENVMEDGADEIETLVDDLE